ncbi:MAG: histidine kinase, partial [Bacteroidales bacterium]|nr:histidine kinase [Bacteroidales bacterium]
TAPASEKMKKQIKHLLLLLLLLPSSPFPLFPSSPLPLFPSSPLPSLPSAFGQIFIDIEWYDADSLLAILPVQEGIEKVNTLNRLAASLSFEDEKASAHYADEALALARKIDYAEGVAGAAWNYGRISFYEGNYPQAINHFYTALGKYDSLGNRNIVGKMYMEIATAHFFANNIEKAIEIGVNYTIPILRSLDASGESAGRLMDTIRTFSKLGLPYRMTGRSDRAIIIYHNYIRAGKENNFEPLDLMLHTGLLAMCYHEINENDSALYYYRKAAAYPDLNPGIRAMKHTHMLRMAGIFLAMGIPDSAIYFYSRSYDYHSREGFLYPSQIAARSLGRIYHSMGRLSDAEHYFRRSEMLLGEMFRNRSYYRYDSLKYIVSWGTELFFPFTKKQVKEAIYYQAVMLYEHLYKFYLERDQIRTAMDYVVAFSEAKDSLRELTRNREAIEIQTKFETDRKDAQILSLNQANELKELSLKQSRYYLFSLAGLVVIIVLFAIILIRHNRLQNRQQSLILLQKLLRSQMNPHFLFNSLTSIQNFVIREKPDLAGNYLSRFSRLVRHILDSSTKELVTLEDEIDTIDNYLALQKVRYRDLFDYEINVDDALDTEAVMVPPMLTQPFIENAIEHGFKHKGSKGNLAVRFVLNGHVLKIEVEDNGIGRKKARAILMAQDKDHISMATGITLDRLHALNRRSKRKITLEITDLKDENGEARGTRVVFEVPVKI